MESINKIDGLLFEKLRSVISDSNYRRNAIGEKCGCKVESGKLSGANCSLDSLFGSNCVPGRWFL